MKRALEGLRVMLTRPAGASDELSQLLRAAGARPTSVPLTRIVAPADEAQLADAVRDVDRFDWLVFTSANGVAAFARCGPPPKLRARIAVIGPATARAVEARLHRTPELMPPRSSGEELARAIVQTATPRARIAIFQARDASPVLAQSLQDAGLTVTRIVAYETIEAPPADLAARLDDADVLILTAGSGVRALVKGLTYGSGPGAVRGKTVVCIGPVTSAEATRLGVAVDVQPRDPTAPGIIAALREYFESKA